MQCESKETFGHESIGVKKNQRDCESKETFGHQLWERLLKRGIDRSERGSLVSKETMAHQLLEM